MIHAFLGLAAATLFGLGTTFILGPGAADHHPWITAVFWALIATGVAFGYLKAFLQCALCRHLKGHTNLLCRHAHCR